MERTLRWTNRTPAKALLRKYLLLVRMDVMLPLVEITQDWVSSLTTSWASYLGMGPLGLEPVYLGTKFLDLPLGLEAPLFWNRRYDVC